MRTPAVIVVAIASMTLGIGLGRLTLRGPGKAPNGQPPPTPLSVARWDGGVLTEQDVKGALAAYGQQGPARFKEVAARRSLVAELARSAILAQLAREQGLDKTPEYLLRQRNELALLALREQQAKAAAIEPSEKEVEAWFTANLALLSRPTTIRVSHILLAAPRADPTKRETRRAEANRLLAQLLRKNASDAYAFSTAAQRSSDDASTRNGGGSLPLLELGELERRLGPEASKAVASLKTGEVAPSLVETEAGFHLLKVLERFDGVQPKLEDARETARARLKADSVARVRADSIATAEKALGLTIDDAAIGALQLSGR